MKRQTTNPPLLRSINEAARLLSIGRTTLYAEIKAGRIQTCKIGKRTLIPYASLQAYVAGLTPTGREPIRRPKVATGAQRPHTWVNKQTGLPAGSSTHL